MSEYELEMPGGAIVRVPESVVAVDGVTVHVHKAPLRTIDNWHKEAFLAVQRSYAEELQEAERMLWEVKLSFLISHATGHSLDVLGRVVGEPRLGALDPSYRVRVRARIAVNMSLGRREDFVRVIQILDPTASPTITLHGRASMTIAFPDPLPAAVANEVPGLLQDTRAAGVRLHVVTNPGPANTGFRFNVAGRGLGFSGAAGYGGRLQHVEIA